MTLDEYRSGLQALWRIDPGEYVRCINADERKSVGDGELVRQFLENPPGTFLSLPPLDQERVFAIVQRKNGEAGASLRKAGPSARDQRNRQENALNNAEPTTTDSIADWYEGYLGPIFGRPSAVALHRERRRKAALDFAEKICAAFPAILRDPTRT